MARKNGQDATITITDPGLIGHWRDWEWNPEIDSQEATSGNSATKQYVMGPRDAELRVTGFEDTTSNSAFADFAALGTAVTVAFGASDGPQAAEIALYPNPYVKGKSMSGSTEPTEWELIIGFGKADA